MQLSDDVEPVRPRVVVVGSAPVDLVLRVDQLPERGDDVLATGVRTRAGGSCHVVRAAADAGAEVVFAGAHGTGPFGDLVRAFLRAAGCSLLLPAALDRDTGCVVVVVDGSGERTCLTAPTAVPPLTAGDLAQVALRPGDLVYVSGYELGLGDESMRLADWIAGIDSGQMVLCDLGPWGSRCGPAVLRPVLGRLDWLACSLREAAELCGLSEDSARELVCTGVQRRAPRSGVVVRDGARGCWVAGIGEPAMRVPGTPVDDPLDTTGAGDTHAGAFLAALGLGAAPVEAARQANAAAARHIASLGSGT